MRTTGKGGYLQYGPGIPLHPRFYRARWIGTVDTAPGGRVGYVEVWIDGVAPDAQPVMAKARSGSGILAQVDFTVPKDGAIGRVPLLRQRRRDHDARASRAVFRAGHSLSRVVGLRRPTVFHLFL